MLQDSTGQVWDECGAQAVCPHFLPAMVRAPFLWKVPGDISEEQCDSEIVDQGEPKGGP